MCLLKVTFCKNDLIEIGRGGHDTNKKHRGTNTRISIKLYRGTATQDKMYRGTYIGIFRCSLFNNFVHIRLVVIDWEDSCTC